MNKEKFAFIMCVTNEQEAKEACYYIEQLELPEGFEKEFLQVKDAESMTKGYQAAMEQSDAKYKIYMHQDSFLLQKDLLKQLLCIFQMDETIGMVGLIGLEQFPKEVYVAADWNVGNIYFNGASPQLCMQRTTEPLVTVDAVDGLFLATQYDVNWRTDLFDGWDFYDVSQCMEMKRRGYRVVVPYQEKPWCYHDNHYSRLKKYFAYQSIFFTEYQDLLACENKAEHPKQNEMEALVEALAEQMERLILQGQKQALWDIFSQLNNMNYLALREFRILAQIQCLEENNATEHIFWQEKADLAMLREKINQVKHQIKRMEFGLESWEDGMQKLQKEVSIFAIAEIAYQYASNRQECMEKMGVWYLKNTHENQYDIWCQLANR